MSLGFKVDEEKLWSASDLFGILEDSEGLFGQPRKVFVLCRFVSPIVVG